jgi:hypothetical protein
MAVLLAGGLVRCSGSGSDQPAVEKAQSKSKQNNPSNEENDGARHGEDARVKSAAGHGGGRGMFTCLAESSRKQVAPAKGPPIILPEEESPGALAGKEEG